MASTSTHIALGPLDHIAPWNIPQSIIYLSLAQGVSAQDAFARLQEGLRRTIAEVPWLNGRVHWQSEDTPGWRPGQLEIRYGPPGEGPPHQLRFNKLGTDLTFADLKALAFPLDTFKDECLLRAAQFEPNFDEGVEVLTAQANFLPGGCALVISVAPPASDGTAMLSVTRIWAGHCSSLIDNVNQHNGLHPVDQDSSFERAVLDSICEKDKQTRTLNQTPPEISRLVGLDPGQYASEETSIAVHAAGDNPGNTKPSLFYIPHAAYTALRKECAAQLGTTDVAGNDLVCALIWRSVVRAWAATRKTELNSTDGPVESISEIGIPFDARPDFMGLLPGNFLGNLNFENRLALPLKHLVAQGTGIPELARIIRTHATNYAGRANLLSAYMLLNSVPDYRQLPQIRAPRMRSASVGVLSPMMLPFNEACFGSQTFGNAGRPEAFRPLMGACNNGFRTCFVIPRKSHGGIEFVMTLSDKEVDFLENDDEFTTYALHMA